MTSIQNLINSILNYSAPQTYVIDDRTSIIQQIPELIKGSPLALLLLFLDVILFPIFLIKINKNYSENRAINRYQLGFYFYSFMSLLSFNFLLFQLFDQGIRSKTFHSFCVNFKCNTPIGLPLFIPIFALPVSTIIAFVYLRKYLKAKKRLGL